MKKHIYPLLIILILFISCNGKDKTDKNPVSDATPPVSGGIMTIAIINDLDFLNPIISMDVTSESIQDLIFPSFTDAFWNDQKGVIEFKPYLAKSWGFSNNGKDLTYYLKSNTFWEDKTKLRPTDILFSYKLYSDPIIASPKQFNLVYYIKDSKNRFDLDRSIEIKNDSEVVFHFQKNYYLQLAHSSMKLIPEHHFKNLKPSEIRNHPNNFRPISAGPYKMDDWKENQHIQFSRNDLFNISQKPFIDKIVFKIIPEPITRLTALKNGEIDFVEGIRAEDVNNIKNNYPNIKIMPLTGRYYDYISWSNIDNEYYLKYKKIKPHSLFGNKKVRQALTMAINRQEIIQGFLGEYGIICNSPISPLFKWAYDDQIKPLEYNPNESIKILKEEGWKDINGDGILEKKGAIFKFALYLNIGNSRREYVASIIQSNLKKIGIDVTIEKVEWNIFGDMISNRKIDAFINGMAVTPQLDLDDYWNSDLEKARLNDPGFQNKRVDELLQLAMNVNNIEDAAPYLKEFQNIIYDEQPCTFLYWYANNIAYNKRLKDVKSNVWDSYNHIWEWWIAK